MGQNIFLSGGSYGKRNNKIYEIMHMDRTVVVIDSKGQVKVVCEQFLPYDLYLEEAEDIDALVNNLVNFYHWCASRVLSLDRKFAKEILNSIGVAQAVTDKDRAAISLSYHCVSLTDVFWVRESGENISFSEVNLYDNPLNRAMVEISLRGKQMTVTNKELAPDLSTKGCFPKAWIRNETGFLLLKDGGGDAVRREWLASEMCQCFAIKQVKYRLSAYGGQAVTESSIVSSVQYSLVSKLAFDIYAVNHGLDTLAVCRKLDPVTYYGMNILDYLTGNTDRHPENWGFLVDNKNNRCVSLYPLMDFNQSFYSYDTLEGANCQTVFPAKMTQLAAAAEAVRHIGLPQIKEPDMSLFGERTDWADMFARRLEQLRSVSCGTTQAKKHLENTPT